MGEKWVVEGVPMEECFDDGGMHYQLTVEPIITNLEEAIEVLKDPEDYKWVTLCSYLGAGGGAILREHHDIHKYTGKKVRVTVEIIDDVDDIDT